MLNIMAGRGLNQAQDQFHCRKWVHTSTYQSSRAENTADILYTINTEGICDVQVKRDSIWSFFFTYFNSKL